MLRNCKHTKCITQQKSCLFLFSHLLTCKNSTIFWDAKLLRLILYLPFFKCFTFFKFTMPNKKPDKINNIRTIFIKIIIKINSVKIYTKNTYFITAKCDNTRIFIRKESTIICIQNSIIIFNHFTCNKQIGKKFQCS